MVCGNCEMVKNKERKCFVKARVNTVLGRLA